MCMLHQRSLLVPPADRVYWLSLPVICGRLARSWWPVRWWGLESVCVRLGVYSRPQRRGRYKRKAHPVHQRGLFPLVSGHAAINPSTLHTPHPIRPLSGHDPVDEYPASASDLVCALRTGRRVWPIPIPKLVRVIQTDLSSCLSSLHVWKPW